MAAVVFFAFAAESHAANRRWNNGTGSFVFNTGGNWVGGVAPGVLDVAQFGISGGMFQSFYTVSFNNNATNQALHIEDDLVTFDLNGRQYTVTTTSGILIGNQTGGFSGRLTVIDGTVSSSTNIDVGAAANTTGTLIVGANGLISGAPTLNIGKLGTGALTVQADGDISSTGSTTIGVGNGITGTATIIGNGTPGSATLVTGTLNVGNTGNGTVNVQLGGLLQNSSTAVIGTGNLFTGVGTGTVNVMNAGSVWNSLGLLTVGDGGTGKANITLGGKVTGANSIVGSAVSGSGEVNVNGPSSLWDDSGTLTIGGLGAGTLNITNQGVVENTAGVIGDSNVPTSTGTVTVNGAGSRWINTEDLSVGVAGRGVLNITAGGTVQNSSGYVGRDSSGTGTVTVDGAGSLWDNLVFLIVGDFGEGTLSITGGGNVHNVATSFIGLSSSGTGTVTVDGPSSLWNNSFSLDVGFRGHGTLEITGGAVVQNVNGSINGPADSPSAVIVNGLGSQWHNVGSLSVGSVGAGKLDITDRGRVTTNGDASIGKTEDMTGTVTVAGADSTWEIGGRLGIGYNLVTENNAGVGTLRIQSGGTVNVTAETYVSRGDLLSLAGGTLSTTAINFVGGGAVNTNFEWTSGTLHVGFFDGDLVNQAGILASTSSSMIQGDYNQLADATLQIGIGGTAQGFFVTVLENAFLGGNLEIVLVNGFVPSSTNSFTALYADLNVFNTFANVANGQRLATVDGLGSFRVQYGPGSAFDSRQIVLTNFLSATPGDCDIDGRVDLNDCTPFPNCMGGPGVPYGPPECECVDLNADGTVDLSDFAAFQSGFTGP